MFTDADLFTPIIQEFTTPDKYEFQYKPISSGSMHFTVQAMSDACISLAEDPNISDEGYEVIIGAINNSMTMIQRLKDEKERVKIKTPDILDPCNERGYWVSWSEGLIAVGLKDNSEPILSWKDPKPITVTHYAVCTGCFEEVNWVIEGIWKFDTQEKSGYRYRPMLWGSMKATINAPHDVFIELTSNPGKTDELYRISLAPNQNPACTIRYKKSEDVKAQTTITNILSKDMLIYITWFNGKVKVLTEGRRLIISWEDPNPFSISNFGVCTSNGVTGHFTIQSALHHFTEFPEPDKAEFKYISPAQFKYKFNPLQAGSIHFTVKMKQDAQIQLTDNPPDEENSYWVLFGSGKNNKRSVIRRGKDEKVWISTPAILSSHEHKGFWVSWDETGIAVGKEGHKSPFMRWADPKPINVTLYGVNSGSGFSGEWLIEGFQKIPTSDKIAVQVHFPITWGSMRVAISAPCDAHVALSTAPQENSQMYQFILGSKNNTTSEILYDVKKIVKARVSTPGILVDGQTAHVLITWFNGDLAVFTHDEKTGSDRLLLAWKDTNKIFPIWYFGVTTSDQVKGNFTITGPSLSRLIVTESPPSPEKYEFKTPAKLQYQYKPIKNGSINFTLLGCGDASIALTNNPEQNISTYEIILRTNPNEESMIQLGEENKVMAAVETIGILSADEPRGFWIRWYNGSIDAGQKGQNLPFIRWTDPEPYSVTHYAVKSANFYGRWIIEDFLDIKTQSPTEYDYKPIVWGHLKMSIMASSQAYVEITPDSAQKDKCYQIIFGNENNKRCTILYGEKEIKADVVETVIGRPGPSYFYMTWFNGIINVFLEKNRLLLASEDTTAQLAFSLIGVTTEVCTGEFSIWPSLDHVTITESPTVLRGEMVTLEKFQFTYCHIKSGSMQFSVKASESATVTLISCDLEGQPLGYVVTLGEKKNTQSIVKSIGDDDPYQAMMETKGILSENESREFWINWKDSYLAVGKRGIPTPFLSWRIFDAWVGPPINYEVSTPEGTAGVWLIEGFLKIITQEKSTPDKSRRPIVWGCLNLRTLMSKEAHISLSTLPPDTGDSFYHIIIGATNNTYSQLYRGSKQLASTHTPGILSPEKFEEFEITWFNGLVNLHHLNRSIFTWKDEEPFGVYLVGFSSWVGVKGYFKYDMSLHHITPGFSEITNELSFISPGVKDYQYKPITCGSINFTVKAHSDAHIILTDDPHKKAHPYKIILGMMSNLKTAIRKGKLTGENASAMTPGILSGDEHRAFWIQWNNGTIAVGKKGELMPIVQWADPDPSPAISHYGLCTKMNYYGEWVIEDFLEIQTIDGSDYCFHPILWGRVNVVVNPKHDGIFSLSTTDGDCDKKYQIQLGRFEKTRCHISIGGGDGNVVASVETPNYLKGGECIPFLLTWFNGMFFAFNEEKKLVIASEDSSPAPMCYFGTRSHPGVFSYFTVRPSLDHFIPSDSYSSRIERQKYEIDTSAGVEYQFKPIISGKINFTVKAKSDAHIVLTNDPAEENVRFWIVIGGLNNTQTAIQFGKTWDKNFSFISTPGILSGDEFRGFWVSWNDGSVAVGKKDSVVPFLRWVDAKPIVVTHCGILTGSGSDGEWVIEDFQKYNTVDDGQYTYFPILWGLMDVTIIAPQDGHIALTTGPSETVQIYHIAIGINGNTSSEICYGPRHSTEAHVETPDILSKDEEKKFLITWFNGAVNVLFEDRLFLAWEDPNPVFMITHFGVCTLSDAGHFSVCPSLESFSPSEVINQTKFVLPIPVTETYVFKHITQGSINFSVKASSDAHIALAEGTDDDCNLKYEIIFGASDNEKTVIRKQGKTGKKEDKAWVNTKEIVKVDEHREFWAKWNNGVVTAGKKGRELPILQWADPETASVVTHYAVGGGDPGEDVKWLIEDTIPVPNTDVDNFVYEPIMWGRLNVTVNAPHNGMIALKTNLKDDKNLYTIALGTSNNEKSSIHYGEGDDTLQAEVSTPSILSEGKDTPFLITWFNGVIAVYSDNRLLLSWENDAEVNGVSGFGVGVWEGAQGLYTATASLDHFIEKEPPIVDRSEYHFKTPAKFEYQFKRILSGAINFTLKTKFEAQVKFSNDLCKHHSTYKVTFGQNSKWTTISKKGCGEKAKVATPGILSDKDSRGFWISWQDGIIDVGQKGSKRPLIRWTDLEPEYITHYKVYTVGSIGYWVIEDFWKITTYPKWNYGFREIKWGSMDAIVNAPHDAYIALTTALAQTYRMYQIGLGSHYNSKCEIRIGSKEEEKTFVDSRHVLSKGKDRSFHITWFNGDVQVYSCPKTVTDSRKLLLKWTDKDSFLINSFGVSTGANSEGRFTVYPSLENIRMTDGSFEAKTKKPVEAVNISEANLVRSVSEVEI